MSVTISTTTAAITVMKQEKSFEQVDLTAKKELCCCFNGTTMYLMLTKDCHIRGMTVRNFDRGFCLVGEVENQHIQSYLDEFGFAESAAWWSIAKPEWQFETKAEPHAIQMALSSARGSRVYFILNPARNIMKIGWTRSINARLQTLQVASPDKLELVGHIEGDRKKEAEFHERFSKYQCNGEWFDYVDELREAVEELLNP